MEEVKKSWNKSSLEKGVITLLFVRPYKAFIKLNSLSRILHDCQRGQKSSILSLFTPPLFTPSLSTPHLIHFLRYQLMCRLSHQPSILRGAACHRRSSFQVLSKRRDWSSWDYWQYAYAIRLSGDHRELCHLLSLYLVCTDWMNGRTEATDRIYFKSHSIEALHILCSVIPS